MPARPLADLRGAGIPAAIDLLVLYTPAARDLAGGTAAIQSQLANAVAVTNTALARSGVNAAIAAVGLDELAYTESSSGVFGRSDRDRGRRLDRAFIDSLRTARDADLVTLVTGRATVFDGCGVARRGPASGAAFSVSEQICLFAGQWSFTHEIGHAFGADHAPGDSPPSYPPYARAYREGPIRTLMAYARARVAAADAQLLERGRARARRRRAAHRQLAAGQRPADPASRWTSWPGSEALPARLPGTPIAFGAVVTGQRVTLSWQPPADGALVTGYELEVGSVPGGADVLRSPVGAPPLDVPGGGQRHLLRAAA